MNERLCFVPFLLLAFPVLLAVVVYLILKLRKKREAKLTRVLGSGLAGISQTRREEREWEERRRKERDRQWKQACDRARKQWGFIVSTMLHRLGVEQWDRGWFEEFSNDNRWSVRKNAGDGYCYYFEVSIDLEENLGRGFVSQSFTVTSARGEMKCPLTKVALEKALVEAFESGPIKKY